MVAVCHVNLPEVGLHPNSFAALQHDGTREGQSMETCNEIEEGEIITTSYIAIESEYNRKTGRKTRKCDVGMMRFLHQTNKGSDIMISTSTIQPPPSISDSHAKVTTNRKEILPE